MTDNNHPITPPPELIRQWLGEFFGCTVSGELSDLEKYLATQAARWGSDTELDACISSVLSHPGFEQPELFVELLRESRRPKPPSLKEQALDAWIRLRNEASCEKVDGGLDCLLRALESLPD